MNTKGDLEFEIVEDEKQTAVVVGSGDFAGAEFVPVMISKLGDDATRSFLSFFVDHIRNRNTREAYMRAANRFFDWCDLRGLQFRDVQSFHVSAYIEELGQSLAIATVKQNLAALRMLFDWLMIRQVCSHNPCHAVRGPKLKVTTGKTPALDEADAKLLLNSITGTDLVSLRDRALIALMIYSFARVSAALSMDVKDYSARGRRMWIQLKEKGGRQHAMPCHHKLEEFLDAYVNAAGIQDQKAGPLFRSARGRTGKLTENRLRRTNAYDAVKRRALQAGISAEICPHSFRATGITNYLTNSGSLEIAQQMAAHADARTTKLYDKRNEQVSLDEIERITI
ncbi:site-specific integrase [bacterium]|nr:site-specific integrase [bacterium]